MIRVLALLLFPLSFQAAPAAAQQLGPDIGPDRAAAMMACLGEKGSDPQSCYDAARAACGNAGVFETCLDGLARALLADRTTGAASPAVAGLDALRADCAAAAGLPDPACVPDRAFEAWMSGNG